MNPWIQWSLVALQAMLAIWMAATRRWLPAVYFGLSSIGAIDYRPADDHWWSAHWMRLEPIRMLARTVVTFQFVAPLPKFAGACGQVIGPAVFIWLWAPLPNENPDRFAMRRMMWLMCLLAWTLISGALASLDGEVIPKFEYWLWTAVCFVHGLGSLRSWEIGQMTMPDSLKEILWRQNRNTSSIALGIVVLVWIWWLWEDRRERQAFSLMFKPVQNDPDF